MRERGYAIGNIDCTIIAQVGLVVWLCGCLGTRGRGERGLMQLATLTAPSVRRWVL